MGKGKVGVGNVNFLPIFGICDHPNNMPCKREKKPQEDSSCQMTHLGITKGVNDIHMPEVQIHLHPTFSFLNSYIGDTFLLT